MRALTEKEIETISTHIRCTVRHADPKHWDDLHQEAWLRLIRKLPKHNWKYSPVTFCKSMLGYVMADYFRNVKKQGFTFQEPNKNRPPPKCPDATCEHVWKTYYRGDKRRFRCNRCGWSLTEKIDTNPFSFAEAQRESLDVLETVR